MAYPFNGYSTPFNGHPTIGEYILWLKNAHNISSRFGFLTGGEHFAKLMKKGGGSVYMPGDRDERMSPLTVARYDRILEVESP